MTEPIPRKDLDDIKEQLEHLHKDVDRQRIIRRVGMNYTFSCEELKELTDIQRYGTSAVQTAIMCYVKLRDPENFVATILPGFPYEEDRKEIREKLNL